MAWTSYSIAGVFKDLSHLKSKTINIEIDETSISINISYGDHCFTDEKEEGPWLFKKRYWSEKRYMSSFDLPDFIEKNFFSAYAIPYFKGQKNGEGYHYMEKYDYAIFFEITKPDIENTLNLKIISAYEVEPWGKAGIPKGKPYKVRWILSQRLRGISILK